MLSNFRLMYSWSDERISSFQTELQNLCYLVENITEANIIIRKNAIYLQLLIKGILTKKVYLIEALIPKGYSKDIIVFYEETKYIPRITNRHMNPDNSLCLESPLNFKKYFENSQYLISDYIYLVDHFIQADEYYQINGKYEYKNYSHGLVGILESLQENIPYVFTNNILKLILFRLLTGNLKQSNYCVCNSRKTISECHRDLYSSTRDIDIENPYMKAILFQVFPNLARMHHLIKEICDPSLRGKVKWRYPQLEINTLSN